MNFTYVMMEIFYKKSRSYLKLVSLLGLKPKLATRYQITVIIWWMERYKEEKLCNPSRSSKDFQIKLLTLYVQRTQIFMNIMMYKKESFSSHSNNSFEISPLGEEKKHRSELQVLLPNHLNLNMPLR